MFQRRHDPKVGFVWSGEPYSAAAGHQPGFNWNINTSGVYDTGFLPELSANFTHQYPVFPNGNGYLYDSSVHKFTGLSISRSDSFGDSAPSDSPSSVRVKLTTVANLRADMAVTLQHNEYESIQAPGWEASILGPPMHAVNATTITHVRSGIVLARRCGTLSSTRVASDEVIVGFTSARLPSGYTHNSWTTAQANSLLAAAPVRGSTYGQIRRGIFARIWDDDDSDRAFFHDRVTRPPFLIAARDGEYGYAAPYVTGTSAGPGARQLFHALFGFPHTSSDIRFVSGYEICGTFHAEENVPGLGNPLVSVEWELEDFNFADMAIQLPTWAASRDKVRPHNLAHPLLTMEYTISTQAQCDFFENIETIPPAVRAEACGLFRAEVERAALARFVRRSYRGSNLINDSTERAYAAACLAAGPSVYPLAQHPLRLPTAVSLGEDGAVPANQLGRPLADARLRMFVSGPAHRDAETGHWLEENKRDLDVEASRTLRAMTCEDLSQIESGCEGFPTWQPRLRCRLASDSDNLSSRWWEPVRAPAPAVSWLRPVGQDPIIIGYNVAVNVERWTPTLWCFYQARQPFSFCRPLAGTSGCPYASGGLDLTCSYRRLQRQLNLLPRHQSGIHTSVATNDMRDLSQLGGCCARHVANATAGTSTPIATVLSTGQSDPECICYNSGYAVVGSTQNMNNPTSMCFSVNCTGSGAWTPSWVNRSNTPANITECKPQCRDMKRNIEEERLLEGPYACRVDVPKYNRVCSETATSLC
jgi:hypothetical protein